MLFRFNLKYSLCGLAICVACSGCVRRRLMVRSNPPGASVYVDKQLIGTTPAASSFTYYGTREIEVVADGFRTEKVLRTLSPPWYQLPPFDFFSETLWPGEIRDERIIDITMVPEQPIASEELQSRANALRLQAAQGLATPLPPTMNTGPDFRNEVLPAPGFPNAGLPIQPIDPTFQTGPGPIVSEPNLPPTNFGQAFQNFIRPGGQPPTRIPEAGILPGGGFRPDLDSP